VEKRKNKEADNERKEIHAWSSGRKKTWFQVPLARGGVVKSNKGQSRGGKGFGRNLVKSRG